MFMFSIMAFLNYLITILPVVLGGWGGFAK